MMNSLYNLLSLRSYAEVRTIATRLQVRESNQNQKDSWIEAINNLWYTSPIPTFQRLSNAAQNAVVLLAQADSVPALLWFAEYGEARPAQAPRKKKEKPPWIEPRNVSEELIYSGLLFFEIQNGHTNTNRVTLPHDLREKVQVACGMWQGASGEDLQHAQPASLLHDLAHYLCYLQEQTELTLMHGRWLSPTRLVELNQRLLQLESGSTHKQSHWQSLLAFLAEAAEFHVQGRLTVQGWEWLGQSPQSQLSQLWQAWQDAAPEIIQAYGQPGSGLSTPWPRPLVEQLAQIEQPFMPAQLTYRILGSYPEFNGYFLAYLGDISTLVMVVTETLDSLLAHLGLVGQDNDWYHLTSLGHGLLTEIGAENSLTENSHSLACSFCQQTFPDLGQTLDQLTFTIPAHNYLVEQVRLTAYAHHSGLVQPEDQTVGHWHRYQLTEATVVSAFSQGLSLQSLRELFVALKITLTPEINTLLNRWWDRAQEIKIRFLPLIQTANPQLMAQLQKQPALASLLAQQLSPTTAILSCAPQAAMATAQQAGYYPQALTSQHSSPPATQSVLWLAGQLYKLLSQHIPLPLPLSATELQGLYEPLPNAEKALLESLLAQAEQNLLAAFDDLVFTPPPTPSEPDQWLSVIEQAIEDEVNLTLYYFTAGRNLLTKRVVEPYWLETHRDIPYLRAYCHQSGQVLTFRLDRIEQLAVDNGTATNNQLPAN